MKCDSLEEVRENIDNIDDKRKKDSIQSFERKTHAP